MIALLLAAAAAAEPAIFEGLEKEAPWKEIVLHHSATKGGSAASFDRYHREHFGDPDGMEYHFVIGNGRGTGDGVLELGSRWKKQTLAYHLFDRARDEGSIAICLVGNFEEDGARPTKKQRETLAALLRVLAKRYRIAPEAVHAHRGIDGKLTQCPGKHFPLAAIREELAVSLRAP